MFSTFRVSCCSALLVSLAACTPRGEGAESPPTSATPRYGAAPGAAPPPVGPGPSPGAPGDAGGPAAPAGPDEPEPPEVDHGPEPQAPTPPDVTIGEPKYTSGEVPDVVGSLKKHRDDMAQCVAQHGGLTAASGKVEVQFLVRARGRAEGVGVNEHEGVSEAAGKCIRDLLKNKRVGVPSEDPIGVTVVIELKEASGS